MTTLTKISQLLGATMLGAACAASAQDESQPAAHVRPVTAPKPAAAAVTPVVKIQAERPTNRIDRQVYETKDDQSASNSSAADALGNVPSVTVDPDGTVSLRGNTNVQILVDGKPSAMLQGENRGAALNAMPSEDIESIEVINNPGAEFGNEGGGGPILNLVMRRNRRPGSMAVINANAGSEGRANSAVNGSYQSGALGFQGGMNFRRDGRDSAVEKVRERIDPITGARTRSTQLSQSSGLNNSSGVNAGLTYNLSDKTSLGAQFGFMRRDNDQQGTDTYRSPGMPPSGGNYVRDTNSSGDSENSNLSLRLDQKGMRPGETFKIDLRMSSSETTRNRAFANQYEDAAYSVFNQRSRQDTSTSVSILDLTGDYERPVDQGIVKLGFKIADHGNEFDTAYFDLGATGPEEILDVGRSNSFKVDETNLALYGSYQRRLSERWSVLGGLRVEHTELDVHQLTAGTAVQNSYTNYIPSMFLTYKASEEGILRLSYAHRIRRPNGNDLNPFIVYRDEFNVSAGNPQLRPSQSDSLELGYETRFGPIDANLRAFFRNEHDVIVERSYFIDNNILLTTQDNGGENRSGGLEFSLSGKLTPKLQINTNGNVTRTEQRSRDQTGLETRHSGSALNMRARVSYQLSTTDVMQLTVNGQGKSLTGQGYREASPTANLTLRHTLTPRLSLVMNVTDVFDSNKITTVIDTPVLQESTVRRFDGRVIYFGLSYRMGGIANAGAAREPGMGRMNRGPGGDSGMPSAGPGRNIPD